jgi:hypothetical protein
MDTNQMLYSSAISIGAYGFYKFVQNLYHKYYLKSECHQQTLEITVVNKETEPKVELESKVDKNHENPENQV